MMHSDYLRGRRRGTTREIVFHLPYYDQKIWNDLVLSMRGVLKFLEDPATKARIDPDAATRIREIATSALRAQELLDPLGIVLWSEEATES